MKRTRELQRRTALGVDPEKVRAFRERGQRSSARATNKRRAISPASPEQREKIVGRVCASCGDPASDPMHLWPRGMGGCDHPDCVLPGCRVCHRLYDDGQLDLEAIVALPDFAAERAHMASHASFQACIRRLRGNA